MRYLEDVVVGQRFEGGPITVDTDEMLAFARRYDPQPFHTDAEAGARSLFGGLAASGWLTAALTMRMVVGTGIDLAWGVLGRQVETLEWPRPVFAGDTLRVTTEVIEVRPSRSRPDRGMIRTRCETFNQHGELVQSFTSLLIVPSRAIEAKAG